MEVVQKVLSEQQVRWWSAAYCPALSPTSWFQELRAEQSVAMHRIESQSQLYELEVP